MIKIKIARVMVYWERAIAAFLVALFLCLVGTNSAYSESSITSEPILKGHVDSLVVEGDNLTAQGWAGSVKPNNKVVSISIWFADKLIYEGPFERFERPDVAEAMGRNDWLKSGWRINMALPINLSSVKHPIRVQARLDDGGSAQLVLNSQVAQKFINGDFQSFVDKIWEQRVILIAIFILLLTAYFLVAFFEDKPCSLVSGNNPLIILLIIVILSLFSALIPPFQSPDEFDHIKRAYLLGKGQLILDTPTGQSSGGDVDSGLLKYMKLYRSLPFHPDAKVSQEISTSAQNIKWSREREFSPAPGTGYYFPLAYAPQAFGLMVGETFDLSVEISYRLARLMVMVSSVILLSSAFSIYPTSPLIIALLLIPMSIFQFCSASLDAFTTALSIFAISIFLRITTQRLFDSVWLVYALGVSVFIVVSCRIHLIPLLALPFFVYLSSKKRNYLFSSMGVSVATFVWLLVAIKSTHDNRVITDVSASDAVKFYLYNPTFFIKALSNTLGNNELLKFYMQSFIGVLGWLDAKFSEAYYDFMYGILILIAIFTVSIRRFEWYRNVLLVISCISVLLVFFALLVTWNPVPAEIIKGVQGRYFLVPFLMVSYALTRTGGDSRNVFWKISIMSLVILAVATIWHMPELLIHRYFI